MHQHWHFTTMGGGGGGVNRERERKKDTVRLTDAETLPKVQVKDILMGSATPIRNSDLYIGGSTRTHLFCWFFLILTRLFLGCRKDTEYFSERCSHLSLSFSRLPHHLLWHNTSSGKHSEGSEDQTWVRGERAGIREGGYGQGKQKASLKLQALWMGKVKIGAENGKGSVTTMERCSEGISPHWLQRLLSTEKSSWWWACTPEVEPPASLSLQFWDANPVSAWPMKLSARGVALPLGDTLHSQNIGGFNDN